MPLNRSGDGMPFIFSKPEPPRFPGEFVIEPGTPPVPQDAADFLDFVRKIIEDLAAEDAADEQANYPERFRLMRQEGRKKTASGLLAEAQDSSNYDPARLTAVQEEHKSNLPKFAAVLSDDTLDAQVNIVMANGHIASLPEERAFLDAVTVAINEFKADLDADREGGFSPSVVNARKVQRRYVGDMLSDIVSRFWVPPRSAQVSIEKIVLLRGRYQALRDRLTKRLFNVHLNPRRDDADRKDLDIRLFSGLPSPDDKPSPEKQDLHVAITKTMTVIRSVCDRITERGDKDSAEARALYRDFMEKLEGIAVIGLEMEFTALAQSALTELRNEFFVRAAARIKNIHVNRLAIWAAISSAILAALFVTIKILIWREVLGGDSWVAEHRNFLLAACGAAIGTWASFAVRQVNFSFDDLVMMEESALKPSMRIVFVMTLTMAACLLFWNNAINIEIGGLRTQAEHFKNAGSVALLIGLFCGLSERALATVIAGRAASFVKGVGGG